MKRIFSMLLAVVIFILPLGVSADSTTSQNVEKALITVKSKIKVPEELTEFSNHVSERNENTYYYFDWNDKEYSQSMSVSCDSEGRITSYNHYKDVDSDKKISDFSKSEIIRFASEFILKTLPETVRGEGDVLVFDEASYDAGSFMRYSMRFERRKETVRVKDNYADVTVCEADGKLFIRSMNVSYDYETEFELNGETVENYISKYKEAFPVELIYRNEYDFDKAIGRNKSVPVLVYRIKDDKIGYIDAVTGEVREEDEKQNHLLKSESAMAMDSAAGGVNRNDLLTPQEIEELEKVEKLFGVNYIAEKVKKLPHVVFSDDLSLSGSDLSKNNEDKYIYRLSYNAENKDDYRYANITARADNGKILSLSFSTKYYDEEIELSESQVNDASEKIAEFLTDVAKEEISQCKETADNIYKYSVGKNYMRIVNGIDYIDNGISVAFDVKNNAITSYRLNFNEGEFENPENAIGEEAAYERILEYAPIMPLYIVSDGVYKRVFTLDCRNIHLDAVSGKAKDGYISENKNYSYSDLDGHWAEEAAKKLAEIQIGFEGEKFNPSSKVTQIEFLRFMASGIAGKYYAGYTEDELYEYLINLKILTEEEKSPDAPVKREDAFVYIIRFAGLEKVASLSDIYKVNYADGNLLSKEKTGYAALLSGLGIICGNGGSLRPLDSVSRGEAAVMLYRYLLNM